ncbi:hypothetical protein HZS_562 [Henneguya salminicola]|nr:hypothetical protein HZS_562 [Henneguya salminicola]
MKNKIVDLFSNDERIKAILQDPELLDMLNMDEPIANPNNLSDEETVIPHSTEEQKNKDIEKMIEKKYTLNLETKTIEQIPTECDETNTVRQRIPHPSTIENFKNEAEESDL